MELFIKANAINVKIKQINLKYSFLVFKNNRLNITREMRACPEGKPKELLEVDSKILLSNQPSIITKKDTMSDKNINPIVIGIFIYLKFIYIKPADIVTKAEDISNIFITTLQNHQSQSFQVLLLNYQAYFDML